MDPWCNSGKSVCGVTKCIPVDLRSTSQEGIYPDALNLTQKPMAGEVPGPWGEGTTDVLLNKQIAEPSQNLYVSLRRLVLL